MFITNDTVIINSEKFYDYINDGSNIIFKFRGYEVRFFTRSEIVKEALLKTAKEFATACLAGKTKACNLRSLLEFTTIEVISRG